MHSTPVRRGPCHGEGSWYARNEDYQGEKPHAVRMRMRYQPG